MNLSDEVILKIKTLKSGAVFPTGILAINAELLDPSFGVEICILISTPSIPFTHSVFLISLKTHSQ